MLVDDEVEGYVNLCDSANVADSNPTSNSASAGDGRAGNAHVDVARRTGGARSEHRERGAALLGDALRQPEAHFGAVPHPQRDRAALAVLASSTAGPPRYIDVRVPSAPVAG